MLKINYSLNGVNKWIKPDMNFWNHHWLKVSFIIFTLVLILATTACTSGVVETAPAAVTKFSCQITGSVDASPMEDRVKALVIEAASKGITITGDYPTDVRNQGGEMTLLGNGFKFVFDANGQIVKEQSKLNLFLTDYPVEGGMNLDGSLGMAVDVGGAKVGIKGQVVDGKFTNGEVRKGWLPHIYGVLNGTTDCKV
jgi:hypothetical protein